MIWSRRKMLVTTALVSALFCHRSARALGQAQGAFLVPRSDIRDFISNFGDFESAAAIGKVALRQFPQLRNEEQLASDLQAAIYKSVRHPSVGSVSRIEPPELRRYLTAAVVGDFENGRIMNVDGWLLAETEVRLCALVALRS